MYEKSEVEVMLKNYLLDKAKLEELESRIEKNEMTLKYANKKYKTTKSEYIEAVSLKAPTISDMPHSRTNEIKNIPEDLGMLLSTIEGEDVAQDNYMSPEKRRQIKNEIFCLNEKAEPLRDSVGKVQRMLKALNDEQSLIINAYYFYKPKWDLVALQYTEVFKTPKSINQLKNIRDAALKTMLQVINI